MAGDPLQGGVGNDQVVGLLGEPGGEVPVAEVEAAAAGGGPGVLLIRAVEHLPGEVEAGDAGLGPALGEEGGDVSGAAAEVGDAGGAVGELGYAGEQVEEGPCAVARVPEVLLGIPGGGGWRGGRGGPGARGIGIHVRASLLAGRSEAESVPAPSMPHARFIYISMSRYL